MCDTVNKSLIISDKSAYHDAFEKVLRVNVRGVKGYMMQSLLGVSIVHRQSATL
jgi:hypothetical protein